MGALANAYATLLQQYGTLAVRFLTQREFDACVREQINNHKTADSCK